MKKNITGLVVTAIVCCVLLQGCRDQATIWSTTAVSPNGQIIASANTEQYGGLGTAYVSTGVYLKQSKSSKPPLLILGFTNESAYPAGVTEVNLRWLSDSQLDVTYKPGAIIDFQAIKAIGVDITVHKIEVVGR
jgi:hypothetical protein